MTSWRGSQGAELEAAAHSDVLIANSLGSTGTAAQLPGSTLTVKDLGRGECCHPQWAVLPTSTYVIKTTPYRLAQKPVSQVSLDFINLTILTTTKHNRMSKAKMFKAKTLKEIQGC